MKLSLHSKDRAKGNVLANREICWLHYTATTLISAVSYHKKDRIVIFSTRVDLISLTYDGT